MSIYSQYVYWLAVVLWCIAPEIKAQIFSFQNYTVEDGLPQSIVYCVHQDLKGYLWAGTQGGICSFDGKQFQTYDARNGLSDNHVTAISEDTTGTLWIGHRSGALSFLKAKNVFRFPQRLLNNRASITSLAVIGNLLCIGTAGNGLITVRLSATDTVVSHHRIKDGLASDFVTKIASTKEKVVLATLNGLNYFDRTSLTVIPTDRLNPTLGKVVNSVFPVSDHVFLLATTDGVWELDELSGNLEPVGDRASYCGLNTKDVLADKQGTIWLATTAGVGRIDDGHFCYSKKNGILSGYVNMILEDREGNIWFSQDDGLSRYRDDRSMLYDEKMGLIHNEVYSILEVSPDMYWIGTAGGIAEFDAVKHRFTRSLTTKDGLPGNFVYNLFKDSKGNIWIGTTDHGAAVFNPDTRKFQYLNQSTGLDGKHVLSINEDSNGDIWLGTLDGGAARYTPRTGALTNFNHKTGHLSNSIWTIFRNRKNELWFGTNDNGLVRYDAVSNEMVSLSDSHDLFNSSFGSITEDSKGNLWIASIGGGVYKYDGTTFTNFGSSIGLKTNNPYFIISDKNDVLWLGTNNGIDRFDPAGSKVTHYGKDEGFPGIETNQNAVHLTRDGKLWIGTVRGLAIFSPDKIRARELPPQIHLARTSLFFRDTLLLDQASLPHDLNHITFGFDGISLTSPDKIRYRYKLDNFDEQWSPLRTGKDITYSQLPSGRYTFHVKAAFQDTPEKEAIASFSFSIRPPYWKTPWFIASSLAFVILTVVIAHRWRLNRILKEERRKTAHELEVAELKMNVLRAQMNPHFIFNCLNSIQYYITINEKDSAITYLSQFSSLIRRMLENSSSSTVVLSDELDLIRHYIEMEQLRLENKFQYVIDVDPALPVNAVKIPSLIIQPYVENAIIHGLKMKAGNGLLQIKLRKEDKHLICIIEDDGIGRARAGELNKKKKLYHRSAGLSISRKRIELLKNGLRDDETASIEIVDLEKVSNKTGTRVEIILPLRFN